MPMVGVGHQSPADAPPTCQSREIVEWLTLHEAAEAWGEARHWSTMAFEASLGGVILGISHRHTSQVLVVEWRHPSILSTGRLPPLAETAAASIRALAYNAPVLPRFISRP